MAVNARALIFNATNFLNSCHNGANAAVCLGIMFQNNTAGH
jgi:hypothetical protein